MTILRMLSALLTIAITVVSCGDQGVKSADAWLISNVQMLDGTGIPARRVDIRIRNGLVETVAEAGTLRSKRDETIMEPASHLILAPGFIDSHSHADDDLERLPDALAAVSQGITTMVVGQDGFSPDNLGEFFARLEAAPAAVHVASFSGHNSLRLAVLGEKIKRPATNDEVERMRTLLEHDLEAGALGLSSGLEYEPGIYSTTDEVITLAREAARAGGRYISHIRSEDRAFWPAIEELITIGREARLPVQISHLKLAQRSLHGQADALLARLDAARHEGIEVTADLYPYTYWQSTLAVLFPDRDYTDRAAAAFAVTELAAPENMLLAAFSPDPALAGQTVASVAAQRGVGPADALLALLAEAQAWRNAHPDDERSAESVIAESMTEDDIARLIQWPWLNICSDGGLDGTHPRGFGTFPRVLGHYVRDLGALNLAQAVHRMTGRAAANLGIGDRGAIAPGNVADLVLFDPTTVADRATLEMPHAPSVGIDQVWVRGVSVYAGGQTTGARPGLVLRRASSATIE